MNKILSVSKNEVKLNSGMSESSFGKTNLSVLLSKDCGTKVLFDKNNNLSFEAWTFSKIETDGTSGQVFFCGDGFEGVPLKQLFENGSEEEIAIAVFRISKAFSEAIQNKQNISLVGAGGIIVGKDSILFLPQLLFENTCNCLAEKEKAEENTCYQFKTSETKKSLFFLRAVFIYQSLTKKLPFTEIDELKRQNDILDGIFLPLEYAINGISISLANAVNEALQPSKIQNNKTQENFPMDELQEELGIQNDGSYKQYERKKSILDEDFNKASKAFFTNKQRKIGISRFLIKNKLSLLASFVCLIFVIGGVNNYSKRLGNLPTTKGLTAEQTIQQFYSGYHLMDMEMMNESSKGTTPQQMADSLSAMYVTIKTRESYQSNAKTYTPERWFIITDNANTKRDPWIYGLTNVIISSETKMIKANLHPAIITRKEKPNSVDKNLKDGEKESFSVSYLRLFTHGEKSKITLESNEESVTCTFKKDKWFVTDVKTISQTTEEIELETLQNDFSVALEKTQNDGIEAANLLKDKYSWIPETNLLMEEKVRFQNNLKNLNF